MSMGLGLLREVLCALRCLCHGSGCAGAQNSDPNARIRKFEPNARLQQGIRRSAPAIFEVQSIRNHCDNAKEITTKTPKASLPPKLSAFPSQPEDRKAQIPKAIPYNTPRSLNPKPKPCCESRQPRPSTRNPNKAWISQVRMGSVSGQAGELPFSAAAKDPQSSVLLWCRLGPA